MKQVIRTVFLAVALVSCGTLAESSPAGAQVVEERWQPQPGLTWQWQLTGKINTSYEVDVYGVDAVETRKGTVDELHADGRKVICYISAGSWENWRPDKNDFPESVKGRPLDGWPGERWLDIRRIETLRPIMESRMDVCREKGFDAVEPDNIDGYTNNSGFPLTGAHQLAYNRMLAEEAHERGLAIALKNDTDQVEALVSDFDFAIVEECFVYKECREYSPFVDAGKAVFLAEYLDKKYKKKTIVNRCRGADELQFSLIFKRLKLDAWRRGCAGAT